MTVLLPFDDARPPVPFEPETLERVLADAERLASGAGFTLLDESYLLATDHFADFTDGSPDNLHFDAAGHARLAKKLAQSVTVTMQSRFSTRSGRAEDGG